MEGKAFSPILPRSHQRWALLGLVLFLVLLSIQYGWKAHRGGSAYIRWLPQINHLEEGNKDLYYLFPDPPIMALLLKGLARLPPLAGALTWFYLKAGLTLLALWWVFRMVATPDRPFPFWGQVLAVGMSLRPIMGDLFHGNVNLFILFLVTAALFAYCQKRELISGLLLALAIACKVTPALFIPYFLWKRSWKTLAGCAAGLVLFLWVIPGLYLGIEQNTQDLMSWYQFMLRPYLEGGNVTTDHLNQSLPGLIFRLGTHGPSFHENGLPTRYDNLVTWPVSWLGWLVKGCMLGFAGLVLVSCRTATAERQGWRLAAEFSMILLGMLLFSERTWKHHCVTLVLPFAVLSYHVTACHPGRRLKLYLMASLGLVVLLMASTSTSLLWEEAAKMAQVYGAYTWANLILLAALVVLLRQQEPANASHGLFQSVHLSV